MATSRDKRLRSRRKSRGGIKWRGDLSNGSAVTDIADVHLKLSRIGRIKRERLIARCDWPRLAERKQFGRAPSDYYDWFLRSNPTRS